MKVSKEKAAQNRVALVEAAARLFRERGIDGVGVAEIGKAAGLTHGALYAHFESKDALAAEALAYGLERAHQRMARGPDGHAPGLAELLDHYLSKERRDDLAGGCAMAASASEIARQDGAVSACFSEGFERMATLFEAQLGADGAMAARERALAMVAAMIGGIAMSRAAVKASPALADEILAAVRQAIDRLAGEAIPPRAR